MRFPYNMNVKTGTNLLSRRMFLGAVASAPMLSLRAAKASDVRIDQVTYGYEDYLYRTPIKFGGTEVDRVTLLNVNCTIRNGAGKVVKGFASMPLGNVWAFPSRVLT